MKGRIPRIQGFDIEVISRIAFGSDYLEGQAYIRYANANNVIGTWNPFAERKIGNYKGTTRHFEPTSNPNGTSVLAFTKDQLRRCLVSDKESAIDEIIG
ncbi:unnamed protein product [Dovyalis caffra]|uniref:Uncharacterized protein n=1 Tax=Dovyalis caffra TaxID=77055 RepID=A0AAV1RJP0_9ROSI|nr:unnamed protein product [Dovyalis caffra]